MRSVKVLAMRKLQKRFKRFWDLGKHKKSKNIDVYIATYVLYEQSSLDYVIFAFLCHKGCILRELNFA